MSSEHTRKRSANLSPEERVRYVLLGVPALGLSFAATTLAAYLPVLARELTTSRTLIGALVSSEGFVALVLPVWIGAFSDRVDTRLGGRLPFLFGTAPIAALALVMLPFGRSFGLLAVEAFVFYAAYFTYYAPYRALYSDLVPLEQSGRAQGIQGIFRGAGMGTALVGGALLLPVWRGLPFVVGATTLMATTLVLLLGKRHVLRDKATATPEVSMPREIWRLLRDHRDIRLFMAANLLWQLAEGGLKSFIVLYLTRGLGRSFAFSAGAMSIVAGAALVAAPFAGKLGDQYGTVKVMRALLVLFGIGLWLPALSRSTVLLFAMLPLVGMGGAMALSLPYAVLMKMIPPGCHGTASGLFDVSGGAGSLLGPLVTGAAIDVLQPLFRSTDGYGAMWTVLGTSILLSLAFLRHPRSTSDAPDGEAMDTRPGSRRL